MSRHKEVAGQDLLCASFSLPEVWGRAGPGGEGVVAACQQQAFRYEGHADLPGLEQISFFIYIFFHL